MDAQRYPLTWPLGWRRTPGPTRQHAAFTQTLRPTDGVGTVRYAKVGLSQATQRLEDQLGRLGAKDALLSTNVALRMDGQPRGGQPEPLDVGVAVYFTFKGAPRCFACDRWTRVADNIVSIANHVDALRRIERYGVGTIEQAFAGYVGLPAKGQTWKTTLGFPVDATPTRDEIDEAFRDRARAAHPDRQGGSHDAMASLTRARTEAYEAIK
jgi:hypothetical protein